jgi:hypothetical protein
MISGQKKRDAQLGIVFEIDAMPYSTTRQTSATFMNVFLVNNYNFCTFLHCYDIGAVCSYNKPFHIRNLCFLFEFSIAILLNCTYKNITMLAMVQHGK